MDIALIRRLLSLAFFAYGIYRAYRKDWTGAGLFVIASELVMLRDAVIESSIN